MVELALHILDIVENATRAGAAIVAVIVASSRLTNLMTISIEDDGPGLPVEPEQALDPFFTTKMGKRTGLGLSLFRAAAEQAAGCFELTRSDLGGVAVRAQFQRDHLDRAPLGDLAGTLAMAALTHPETDFWCVLRWDEGETVVQRFELAAAQGVAAGEMGAVRGFEAAIREGLGFVEA